MQHAKDVSNLKARLVTDNGSVPSELKTTTPIGCMGRLSVFPSIGAVSSCDTIRIPSAPGDIMDMDNILHITKTTAPITAGMNVLIPTPF